MSDPNEPKVSNTPIVVDEHATITPMTHQEIKTVHGTEWMSMSVSKLRNEQSVLRNRQMAMLNMGKKDIAKQIENGIRMIEAIIIDKYKKSEERNK